LLANVLLTTAKSSGQVAMSICTFGQLPPAQVVVVVASSARYDSPLIRIGNVIDWFVKCELS